MINLWATKMQVVFSTRKIKSIPFQIAVMHYFKSLCDDNYVGGISFHLVTRIKPACFCLYKIEVVLIQLALESPIGQDLDDNLCVQVDIKNIGLVICTEYILGTCSELLNQLQSNLEDTPCAGE